MSSEKSLVDELEEVLALHSTMIKRRIDASACGTNHDFRRMHAAEDAYHDAKGAFEERLEKIDEELPK